MQFTQVMIKGVTHVDAPEQISSTQLEDPLGRTMQRLGLPSGLLENLTGIRHRRFWPVGFLPSAAASLAAERLLAAAGVEPSKIGVLISTSVSRDYIEPSVACFVHHKLGLSEKCINFDLANACLGFLNGMDVVSTMIEARQVDYGLVVAGESSREVVERTVDCLAADGTDTQTFREQFATLTLGSGAAAALLCHSRFSPAGHQYLGSTSLAATAHNMLCRGQVDGGVTDTHGLLQHGVGLAGRTWSAAQAELGWPVEEVDQFALHQVSQVHTQKLAETVGIDLQRVLLLYPEFGNVGPASIPMVLSKAAERGRLEAGDRVVLAGIGSGLNCTAAGVLW